MKNSSVTMMSAPVLLAPLVCGVAGVVMSMMVSCYCLRQHDVPDAAPEMCPMPRPDVAPIMVDDRIPGIPGRRGQTIALHRSRCHVRIKTRQAIDFIEKNYSMADRALHFFTIALACHSVTAQMHCPGRHRLQQKAMKTHCLLQICVHGHRSDITNKPCAQ
jgi:hypothetical protein